MAEVTIKLNSQMVNQAVVNIEHNLVRLEYNTGKEYQYLTDTPVRVLQMLQEYNENGGSVGRLLHSWFRDYTLIPEHALGL